MLPLLLFVLTGGIKAEDIRQMHYRLKNDSLCLHVSLPANSDPTWLFNKKVIVRKNAVTHSFIDKVDYKSDNISLCINRLTHNDSGIYKVTFYESDEIQTHSHVLQVQDAVPKPVLSISPMFSNQSAELCNMTNISVNCSIQEEWLTSICDQDSCLVTQESLQQYNITVITANKSVICIGSNQVSTSNVSASIDQCETDLNKSQPQIPEQSISSQSPLIAVGTVWAILAFVIFIVFILRKYAKDSAGATQPEEPPHPLAEAPGSSSVSGRDATAAQASQPRSQSPGSNHEQSLKVDTIYSVLGEKSVDKRAEVPSGPTVSQSEEGTVIDSVYSMLQAPKTATRQ